MRRYNRLTVTDIVKQLDDSLVEHSSCHTTPISNDDEDFVNDTVNDSAMFGDVSSIVEDIISNMFCNMNDSPFNKRLKQAIIERETSKKYPDYLIKKYWLKNLNYNLYPEEVVMFLRHVRFIMNQSRQGNSEITHILSSLHTINAKKYNDVFQRYQEQSTLLAKSKQLIESLKATMVSNGIAPNLDILDESLATLSPHEAIDQSDDSSYIHLRLPVTQSDVRQLLETNHSFMSNTFNSTTQF